MTNTTEPHRHYFARAIVRDANGMPMPEGRRCSCGMETIGDGPLGGVNAQVVRAGQRVNVALADSMRNLAAAFEAARDRTRER